MSYTKAVLEVELFDVEDVITTSGASGSTVPVPIPSPKAPSPEPDPEPDPNDLI